MRACLRVKTCTMGGYWEREQEGAIELLSWEIPNTENRGENPERSY